MSSFDTLLHALMATGSCSGGAPAEEVEFVEQLYGLNLPESYGQFLRQCGAVSLGPLEINGLGVPFDSSASVVNALNALRAVCSDAPKGLVPIRLVGPGLLHCLLCPDSSPDMADTPVRLFDLNASAITSSVSDGFADYLQECFTDWKYRMVGLRTMESHVTQFEEDYLNQGKLPRNHVWRPFRFCSQDVVLGLAVVRHSIDNNWLEVDVCLTSDVPEYEPGSGAKMTASFLLSEAYKCGGSMEIRFTDNVEDRHVPRALCDLCDTYGVTLQHAAHGRITPLEARRLYVALTDFTPVLRDQIQALARVGRLSQERACYAVHHGLWTRAELETIVLGSPRADSILGGDAQPEQRHLYQNDLAHARASVMGGFLDRKLAKRARGDGNEALDLEDDVRPLEISFDPTYYAKVYSCSEELPVPWTFGQLQDIVSLPTGVLLIALLRARDTEDLTLHLEQDLHLAGEWLASLRAQGTAANVFVLVPREFDNLPHDLRVQFADMAHALSVGIMVCAETTVSLETDAARRLSSSRIMRE